MFKVKKVGVEFLGIEERELQSSSSSSSSSLIFFPKLKCLMFGMMREWEEWEGVPPQNNITIMPSLSRLAFHFCSKLGTLPDFLRKTPLLKTVIVWDSRILGDKVRDKTSEEWAKISHVPDIQMKEL
ncbi:uncharacterized protein LOC121051258 [Rosa chinensis]|uniref:uncharacterized protein LOC121051258 n=1 Tax=Rosa chinensis TaxID=74649 RepID=UPI001AD8FED8|nr:uncharacterized protein LOC121051258 [Rosa chinensis]